MSENLIGVLGGLLAVFSGLLIYFAGVGVGYTVREWRRRKENDD